jgi:hypothetical protein
MNWTLVTGVVGGAAGEGAAPVNGAGAGLAGGGCDGAALQDKAGNSQTQSIVDFSSMPNVDFLIFLPPLPVGRHKLLRLHYFIKIPGLTN